MGQAGFRPLAGFWFLNFYGMTQTHAERAMFPSPCGVPLS